MPKNAEKYFCELCNFKCSKKSNFDKHLLTAKHKILTNPNEKMPKNAASFMCSCGKEYKHKSTLSKHRKNCEKINNFFSEKKEKSEKKLENKKEENVDYKEMFISMMNDNIEMRKTIQEMVPHMNHTTNNTTNNQVFNIQIFLDEKCKDALNIMDFVNSLHLQLEDLENTGKLGLVEGTTKIFLDGLKQLDLYKRPIHCTDLKKETVYVRDNDQWEKDVKCDKMKKAISSINDMNLKQAAEWIDENPEKHDDYLNIMNNVTKSDISKESEQIIKNVSKEIMVPPPEK